MSEAAELLDRLNKGIEWRVNGIPPPSQLPPSQPPSDGTAVVLQEHVAFLRQMLAEKDGWRDTLLAGVRSECALLRDAVAALTRERDVLRLALAEATVHYEHEIAKDDANTQRWRRLTKLEECTDA